MAFPTSKSENDEWERWNRKYREAPTAWTSAPDPLLVSAFTEYILPLHPSGGNALDLAGGSGRHAIWLAEQGWEVTLTDISEAGLERARQNAGPLAEHIHFLVNNLTGLSASQTRFEQGFEVVMVFFYLERTTFPELLQAIRPGGLLIYKTYTSEQAKLPKGPKNPAHLLEAGELFRLAAGLQVLHYREEVAEKATAELVARKVATGNLHI